MNWKRLLVTAIIVAPAVAFGLWRDSYIDPDTFDYLAFAVGLLVGFLLVAIWAVPAIEGFDRLQNWMNR